MTPTSKESQNRIRSFIRRQGRATPAQKKALEEVRDKYCLDPSISHDFTLEFGRQAPLIVEIGFGNGTSLAEMAEANPTINYLGIEVHTPGIGHLMMLLEQKSLSNVRIFHHDAIEILEQNIPDDSLSGVHLFFPDPWHKRRHHKRRIVRPSFIELLNNKLISGGYFHAATDWEHYAKQMLVSFSSATGFVNSSKDNNYWSRPEYRPLTKFEKRGLRLGHEVWDLIFKKI